MTTSVLLRINNLFPIIESNNYCTILPMVANFFYSACWNSKIFLGTVVVSLGINCSSVYYKIVNSTTLFQNDMYCYQEKGNPEVNSLLKVFQIIKNYMYIHLYKLYFYM